MGGVGAGGGGGVGGGWGVWGGGLGGVKISDDYCCGTEIIDFISCQPVFGIHLLNPEVKDIPKIKPNDVCDGSIPFYYNNG